jgi:hypothetical protein
MAKKHNARFAELQEEYLKTRDHAYLDKMYRLCVEIATNYITKYARERGLQLDVPGLSHDSAIYAIEQYLKKPGFRINRISAYMHFGCVKTLYRDKDRDQREVSYDEALLNEGYEAEAGREGGDRELAERPGAAWPRAAPQGGQHAPAIIKQGLLFEESDTGRDYEEIFV